MTSSADRPTILLSGGTGVLGRALIDELSSDHDIICLIHRTPADDPRVREVQADLLTPGLGLSDADRDALAAEVDIVLHCAAATNWRASAEDIRRVNLTGTTTMLDMAERAGAPMYYMSTAFVANPLTGTDKERFPGAASYLESKIEAEQAVRDSSAPGVILRPSVIMGDSRTGEMAGSQGFTKAFGSILKGRVPVLPGAPDSRIDLVPQDVVAGASAELIRAGVTSGEYWLTAGKHAMNLNWGVDFCLDYAEQFGPRPDRPRLIPIEAVDRLLIPMLEGAGLPDDMRQMFRDYAELLLVFQQELPVESSLGSPNCGTAPTSELIENTVQLTVKAWARGPRGLRAVREAAEREAAERSGVPAGAGA